MMSSSISGLILAILVLSPSGGEAGLLSLMAKGINQALNEAENEMEEQIQRRPFLDILPSGPKHPEFEATEDVGGHGLMLSKYINRSKPDIYTARREAAVDGKEFGFGDIDSYSGYITVNEKHDSNLFFWLFPAMHTTWKSAPLVVWFNGGPGSTSLYGLFIEHGPLAVDAKGNISKRRHTWASTFNLLFIDQPVGTGFSFTQSPEGHVRDQEGVARDLYEFMKQFYVMFPELLKNDLYITGESYAGKYVPALSHKIHTENRAGSKPRMPLKGLAIGDGACDPINQLGFGEFLYQTGMVDEADRETLKGMDNAARDSILHGEWAQATYEWNRVIDFFTRKTGSEFYYNYLVTKEPADFEYFHHWLMRPEVRRAIHAGNRSFEAASNQVYGELYTDIAKSVKPWIEELMNANYKVMFYNGQLDVIIPYTTTENFISKLRWHGDEKYRRVPRQIWRVSGEVAGYAREVGNFRQVMVRNAGHLVPYDQPKWAFDLMNRFVWGKSFAS